MWTFSWLRQHKLVLTGISKKGVTFSSVQPTTSTKWVLLTIYRHCFYISFWVTRIMHVINTCKWNINLNTSKVGIQNKKYIYINNFDKNGKIRTNWYGHIFFIVHVLTCTNYENHIFCYNFSCVNVCEIRICHILHLFIRYTMSHFLYWK